MSEWRPIETAPKDGTRIDVWVSSFPPTINVTGWRETEAFFDSALGWVRYPEDEDCSEELEELEGSDDQFVITVTHWMPIPDPPTD